MCRKGSLHSICKRYGKARYYVYIRYKIRDTYDYRTRYEYFTNNMIYGNVS